MKRIWTRLQDVRDYPGDLLQVCFWMALISAVVFPISLWLSFEGLLTAVVILLGLSFGGLVIAWLQIARERDIIEYDGPASWSMAVFGIFFVYCFVQHFALGTMSVGWIVGLMIYAMACSFTKPDEPVPMARVYVYFGLGVIFMSTALSMLGFSYDPQLQQLQLPSQVLVIAAWGALGLNEISVRSLLGPSVYRWVLGWRVVAQLSLGGLALYDASLTGVWWPYVGLAIGIGLVPALHGLAVLFGKKPFLILN